MAELSVEDTVILWDCSRSMMRTDFKPSRLRVAQKLIKIFIEKKIAIDYKDSIAVALFGSRTKRISDFSSDVSYLFGSLANFEISGHSNVEDGIALALQLLIAQIRKIGGKTPRIMIFTDNSSVESDFKRIEHLANVSKNLGVFIDVCQIGAPKSDEGRNVLKELAYSTNAEYAFFKNNDALFFAAEGFASKKGVKETDYFDPNREDSQIAPDITKVSVDLRRPTINEIRTMMKEKTDNKCQICYQNTCPTCSSPFYACGRFCPSCNRPIHLHCATLWAEKSDFNKKNVFRCPFCYFLLKVPSSVPKLMSMTGGRIRILDEDISHKPVKMVKIPEEKINDIDDACLYCNNIFADDNKVFQCSGCGSYYHDYCYREMYEDIKACRNCGGEIN
jgi:hypothetical protein